MRTTNPEHPLKPTTTMNSPTEPGSPSPSTPSSGSPPPDEIEQIQAQSSRSGLMKFASGLTNASPGASKRRLPGGSAFGAASSSRDAKTRRKEEGGGRRLGGDRSGDWGGEGKGNRREKDELVDGVLVENLRKGEFQCAWLDIDDTDSWIEFGDPFMEDHIKSST